MKDDLLKCVQSVKEKICSLKQINFGNITSLANRVGENRVSLAKVSDTSLNILLQNVYTWGKNTPAFNIAVGFVVATKVVRMSTLR